jgi:hypothetical protein
MHHTLGIRTLPIHALQFSNLRLDKLNYVVSPIADISNSYDYFIEIRREVALCYFTSHNNFEFHVLFCINIRKIKAFIILSKVHMMFLFCIKCNDHYLP